MTQTKRNSSAIMYNQGKIDQDTGQKTKQKRKKRRKQTEFKHTSGFQPNSPDNLLPAEITIDIFSRLPLESALECKRVCKTWRTLLVHDTHFPYMHLERCHQLLQQQDNQYYSGSISGGVSVKAGLGLGLIFSFRFLDTNDKGKVRLYYGEHCDNNIDEKISYENLKKINHRPIDVPNSYLMVGSCNGLFCFTQPYSKDLLYICNPINREYVRLQSFNPIGKQDHSWIHQMVFGFGYHPSSNEYKVVKIYYSVEHSFGQVHVYTVGSRSGFRNKGKSPWSISKFGNGTSYAPPLHPGILANGALHWLNEKEGQIISFDLADEEFSVVAPPPCFLPAGYDISEHIFQLRELGGCLCVTHQQKGHCVDIWSLKKTEYNPSYRMEEQEYQPWTWSKEFSIRWNGQSRDMNEPFALTSNSEVLLWHNKTILTRYDPKTETFKTVMDRGGKSLASFEAIPHMMSFISLRALGEKCI